MAQQIADAAVSSKRRDLTVRIPRWSQPCAYQNQTPDERCISTPKKQVIYCLQSATKATGLITRPIPPGQVILC
jgi:hypothetical protein